MKTVLLLKVPESLMPGDVALFVATDEAGDNLAEVNVQIDSLREKGDKTHFTGIDHTHPWISLPIKGFLPKEGRPGKMIYRK